MAQSENKRTIVDAQAHLWKAESEDWKWVPENVAQLNVRHVQVRVSGDEIFG